MRKSVEVIFLTKIQMRNLSIFGVKESLNGRYFAFMPLIYLRELGRKILSYLEFGFVRCSNLLFVSKGNQYKFGNSEISSAIDAFRINKYFDLKIAIYDSTLSLKFEFEHVHNNRNRIHLNSCKSQVDPKRQAISVDAKGRIKSE